ncbi:LysR family transcriptional regulator [Psychromonas sp. psych-6C06]|uniref:LysR family transcriptional regulator n=1 Tax=Psychromonas sp. psych-6C06 TaxID=2058089 RepID=UPI000C325312|nr:LysR family transcriptional regulator [Psychromonas sp. psych-6C06]PKF61571.1 LysR family transcriptional regulator [Psychromonas sp. psych-6C06]
MNFSFEQLLAFVTVYNERAFSKAAVKLNKHRTTIGQVVTNLEDQLAVTLFERVGRTVIPTEDGEFLYHYAKQTIEHARTFDNVALSLSFGAMENITIAYPSFVPHGVLANMRIQLAKEFPLMRVNFIVCNQQELKIGINDGTIDFALVNTHYSRAMNSIDASFLGHIEFLPFVKKGGRLSQLKANEAHAVLSTERQFILKSFREENLQDKILLSSLHEEVEQLALIIKLVSMDAGWSLLPKIISASEYVTDNIEAINFSEMTEGFKFAISLWCPHAKSNREIKQTIIDSLKMSALEIRDQFKS